MGLVINSLWLWMIPIVLGWVYVGTQSSAESIKTALNNTIVPALNPEGNLSGECVGIRDRTTYDDYSLRRHDWSSYHGPASDNAPHQQEGTPVLYRVYDVGVSATTSQTRGARPSSNLRQTTGTPQTPPTSSDGNPDILLTNHIKDVETGDLLVYGQVNASNTLQGTEQQSSRSLSTLDENSISSPPTFLGLSIAGDDLEPGPFFNYARVWTYMSAAKDVAEAFLWSTKRQAQRQTVATDQKWTTTQEHWDDNLQGTPEEMSKYINPHGKDIPNLSIHAPASSNLTLNCITAAFIARFLQWGTTVAAIIIAYK